MKRLGLWAILSLVPVWAGEMPPKTAEYHEALAKRAETKRGPLFFSELAEAKIRLGDIEGGVRDLQSMAGEKGLDLRALSNLPRFRTPEAPKAGP